jgi:hypothetical protein
MKLKFILPILFALLAGCEKEIEPMPEKPLPTYFKDYVGKYQSLKVISNGNDVTGLMTVNLRLDITDNRTNFNLEITEKNPSTGTTSFDTLSGGWFLRTGLDTLIISKKIGQISNVDSSTGETYWTDQYWYQYWVIQKIAPGTYSMKREYKGANQDYHMEKL